MPPFKVGRQNIVSELMLHTKITPLTPRQRDELVAELRKLEGVRTAYLHSGASSPLTDVFEIIIKDGVAPYAHEVRAEIAVVVYDFQEVVIAQPSPH